MKGKRDAIIFTVLFFGGVAAGVGLMISGAMDAGIMVSIVSMLIGMLFLLKSNNIEDKSKPKNVGIPGKDFVYVCPQCGCKDLKYQVVTEDKKTGCGTILLYVLLALTIFGLLIVIPLMLRNKHEQHTYGICPKCGFSAKIE